MSHARPGKAAAPGPLTVLDLRKLASHQVRGQPGARQIPAPVLIFLAALTGCVGGLYGIGGGSILAPILIGSGRPAAEVAPPPWPPPS